MSRALSAERPGGEPEFSGGYPSDGFSLKYASGLPVRLPGEFESHSGCIMVWPSRPGSWPYGAKAARKAFRETALAIAKSEKVYMLAGADCFEDARAQLPAEIGVLPIETDDAWARDIGPTFVKAPEGCLYGIDWAFNAWGGAYNGLYASWEKDDAAAAQICAALGIKHIDAHPFVLEGGSVHSDGEGTLMVTRACLLSKGRNPSLSKDEIEERLLYYLGAQKILWLPHGICGDETDEHVDNIAAFVRPGEIVLAWTDDTDDPQYAYSKADLEYLSSQTDAKGRPLKVHKLLLPSKPVCITEHDLAGYSFEPGEDIRKAGERLAASYVNFYISNGAVIIPAFGDRNDKAAADLLARLFPERETVQIPARDILPGGGNIHCITQQIPK